MAQISGITVLGDGLSDQGRFGRLTGGTYPPSPPFHTGRWTGGPTWVELLATDMGVTLRDTDNLAQGGATTGWFNINEPLRQRFPDANDPAAHGVTEVVEPYLPMDYIDFSNPLAPARPLPADRARRSPEEFLTFWAVSAGSTPTR